MSDPKPEAEVRLILEGMAKRLDRIEGLWDDIYKAWQEHLEALRRIDAIKREANT
jgi:hypothetical protein